jgi:hypothetical protein
LKYLNFRESIFAVLFFSQKANLPEKTKKLTGKLAFPKKSRQVAFLAKWNVLAY